MTNFSFLHAADIHLDSPLDSLAARDPGFSQTVRGATRRALESLVRLAIDDGVKFVLISGDLYDGTLRDMATAQFALRQFGLLARAGIRVIIIHGNHDAESRITRHLTPPEGVIQLANNRCQTYVMDDIGVAVHGRSYKEAHTFENLAQTYCKPTAGLFNIAMLHTALEGNAAHAPYAPCSVGELVAQGHDYWALGHVHERAVLHEVPHIVFPGNLQGRHVREPGAKGAFLVHVENGSVVRTDFRALDEVRFTTCSIDTAGMTQSLDLDEAIRAELRAAMESSDGRTVAVRLRIAGSGAFADTIVAEQAWLAEQAQAAASAVSEDLWIERIKIDVVDEVEPSRLPPEIEDLLAAAATDPGCLAAIDATLADLRAKLPASIAANDMTPLLSAARDRRSTDLAVAAHRLVAARLNVLGDQR